MKYKTKQNKKILIFSTPFVR